MYCPIQLHHEARRVAVEVDDEAVDDLLAAEVEAIQLVRAEPVPEAPLGERHIAA
jgi:hypothetical protein